MYVVKRSVNREILHKTGNKMLQPISMLSIDDSQMLVLNERTDEQNKTWRDSCPENCLSHCILHLSNFVSCCIIGSLN